MDAIQITSAATESDPTLSSLVPRRSTRRNLLLAATVLLLIVGIWTSPHLLRPSVLAASTHYSSSTPLARQHQVLTTAQLTADGWPNVVLQSMGDLPGARVAGAWVIPGPLVPGPLLAGPLVPSQAMTDPGDYTTGLDYLRASFPRADFGKAGRLPHSLDQGESAQLFILWDITDCSRLIRGRQGQIELTSILGTTTREQLPIADLVLSPICPTP
jgi:hypothetical protein